MNLINIETTFENYNGYSDNDDENSINWIAPTNPPTPSDGDDNDDDDIIEQEYNLGIGVIDFETYKLSKMKYSNCDDEMKRDIKMYVIDYTIKEVVAIALKQNGLQIDERIVKGEQQMNIRKIHVIDGKRDAKYGRYLGTGDTISFCRYERKCEKIAHGG